MWLHGTLAQTVRMVVSWKSWLAWLLSLSPPCQGVSQQENQTCHYKPVQVDKLMVLFLTKHKLISQDLSTKNHIITQQIFKSWLRFYRHGQHDNTILIQFFHSKMPALEESIDLAMLVDGKKSVFQLFIRSHVLMLRSM